MKVESYGLSNTGLVRKNNEDVWAEIPHLNFFALADGMGGHNAGEVAAQMTVDQMVETVERRLPPLKTLDEVSTLLEKAIERTNARVHQRSFEREELSGMGTTLSCLLLHGNHLLYAHVGDSRLYRYRGSLEQLTKDHSRHDGKKLLLTQAVGTTQNIAPDIEDIPVDANDIYFLCSDGLTDLVSDDKIAAVIEGAPTIKCAVQDLVDAALRAGGRDNISIVMVRILP